MSMPDELPALQHHLLSPFERHVIYHLSVIEADGKATKANVETILAKPDVTLEVKCCPCPPVPPVEPGTSPAPAAPILAANKGDSVTMIRVPVTKVPDMPVNANGVPDVKLELSYQESGGAVQVKDVTANVGGTSSFDVTDGSNGEAWCNSFDAKGNRTLDSVHATWTNASDGQASPPPAAPELGAGDEAPAPAPVLGTMKKVK